MINGIGMRQLVAALSLVLAGLLAAAPPAQAQEGGQIARILVEGNQRIEPETVRSYILIREGDAFEASEIDRSLKTLFATGLFADVTITPRGNDLVIAVVENPIINRVAFEGNDRLTTETLDEEVQLRPRVVFTRAKVQADVQRLVELYRRSGRFSAAVEPKIVELPQNRVDLIFEINEGPVTGIKSVNFIGNVAFDDSDLKGVIATTESSWWNFLQSNDNYDPDRLAYDREQLRRFYLSEGYADFRVVSAVAELSPDREDFFLTFTVEEGEQYRVGETVVSTELETLNAEALEALIYLQPGEVYNADEIEATVDALTFAAGAYGFAFVDVRPRVTRHREEKLIDITFEVNEGPRVYIERINISGNTRTLDRVIRREFRLVEGDAFNRVLLDRSRTRVRGLGFFEKVEVSEEPGSAPDKTVVNVEVEEKSTGELSIGAGFSSADSFITDLSISERNLLGRGQFLRLRLSLSARRQQVDVRFTEPYFLGRNLSAGIDLFKLRTDFQSESSFDMDSVGGGVRFGFPLSEFAHLSPRYTFRRDEITDVDARASLAVRDAIGTATTSAIGATFSIDRRNDPLEPTGGWSLALTEDAAGLGGDVKYLRTEARAGWYRGLLEDVTLSLKADAGYIFGWGDEDIRLNDRFYKGGPSFRGFETSGIGPRDPFTEDAVGGQAYAIGSVEVSFPLGLPKEFGLSGSVFTDFGSLGVVDNTTFFDPVFGVTSMVEDNFALRMSAGVGLFWESPFGPIRIDLAEPFMKEDFDQVERFRFSAGTRF